MSDKILVQLAREVESGDTVVVKINLGDLTGNADLISLSDKAFELLDGGTGRFDETYHTITFDSSNWDKAVVIDIFQRDDSVREDPETAILSFGLNKETVDQDMGVGTWNDEGTDKIKLTLSEGGWVASGFSTENITISNIFGITSATIVGFEDGGLTALLDISSSGVTLGTAVGAAVSRTLGTGEAATIDANNDYIFPNLRSGTGLLDVEVIDNDTAGSVVLESGRDTVLIPDDLDTSPHNETVPDTYKLRLTMEPDTNVDVAILTDGLADVTAIDRNADGDFLDAGEVITASSYQTIGGLRPVQLFNGTLNVGNDGTNLTLTRGAGSDLGSFASEGWAEGDLIRIANTGVTGLDDDYEIKLVSPDGMTITLTASDSTTSLDDLEDVVLSKLIETEIWTGQVQYEFVDGADRIVRLEASVDTTGQDVNDPAVLESLKGDPNYDQQGFLGEGFVEGMRVRITNAENDTQFVDAKIAIIRGFNGSKDHTLQFTLETNGDFAAAAWLTDGSPVNVEVNRIAVEATFTSADYYKLQTIELSADPYYEVPTTREGVKIFPVKAHRLSNIRGPLAVEGGPSGADRSLTNGVKLPGEEDAFLFAIGTQAPESQQIDVLNIFNDGSKADTTGILTETTLTGFGMGPDLVFPFVEGPLFGEGVEDSGPVTLTYPGGISFGKVNFGSSGVTNDNQVSTVEVVNVMLGEGNDFLEVQGTLNPAPHVSAQNVFTEINNWQVEDENAPGYDQNFIAEYTGNDVIFREGFNWKGEGFLVGQDIYLVDGEIRSYLGVVIGIEDALAYTLADIDPNTDEPYRDPNDNSLLILDTTGNEYLGNLPTLGDVKLIAEDKEVFQILETVVSDATAGGATITRSEGDWEGDGFLEGHLLQVGIGVDRQEYRIVEIDGATIKVEGANLIDGSLGTLEYPEAFWVQGAHGGLTVLHGGGNLYVNVEGQFNIDTDNGETRVVRLDGRSFGEETGFEVGQVIQLEGETNTREILAIDSLTMVDAATYGEDNPFNDWGFESVLVLSDPLGGVQAANFNDGTTVEDFLIHQAEALETTTELNVRIEIAEVNSELETIVTLIGDDADDTWEGLGYVQYGVLFIEGYAGGFQIKEVQGDTLILVDAALRGCADHNGEAKLTFTTYDITRSGGQRVGGDHFVVTGGAGPDSPLVIYGDTSQDGVWYSGHSYDRLGLEFGEKPFDPFPQLPDSENEDDEWVFALANPFDFHGHDIIDASALFVAEADAGEFPSVGITAYGGMGDDLIIGSQTGDHLAGGSGNDIIIGQRGTDHIYGDSGVNVNILTRALTIATLDQSPLPTVDPTLARGDSSIDPTASPVRDPLADETAFVEIDGNMVKIGAGNDIIEGNGSGLEDGTPDIIFGDHGEVIQNVFDPNLPDPSVLQASSRRSRRRFWIRYSRSTRNSRRPAGTISSSAPRSTTC